MICSENNIPLPSQKVNIFKRLFNKKQSEVIENDDIGEEIGRKYDVKYLPSDFKKRDGYKRSVALSKEFDLYRQDYCGCIFSKAERNARKERTEDEL